MSEYTGFISVNEAIELIEPEDLIRYGLIPEFVGRLPVLGTLNELDENALVRIMTEPKNALLKQYQRKFEFDNIRLKFSDDAVRAIHGTRDLAQGLAHQAGLQAHVRITHVAFDFRFGDQGCHGVDDD